MAAISLPFPAFVPRLARGLLTRGLRDLPDGWHSRCAALLCTHLLRGQSIRRRWAELADKRIAIAIHDTGNEWLFRITPTGLAPLHAGGDSDTPAWDVRIHGDLEGFFALAGRREDPDTLFFERRLSIEGDTELGLAIKNLLDALDFDLGAHFTSVLGAGLGTRTLRILQRGGLDRLMLQALQRLLV